MNADEVSALKAEWRQLDAVTRRLGALMSYVDVDVDKANTDILENHTTEYAKPDVALAAPAKKVYLARRVREEKGLQKGIFSDPAWSIMLDLFIAHASDKYVSVTDAGVAANIATSTALRWIWTLEKANLIERHPDKKR